MNSPSIPVTPRPADVPADIYADFSKSLANVAAQPLWDRYGRVTRRSPAAMDAPMHWPWAAMSPLIDRAVREVSMQDAERRVLLLTHPAFKDSFATTTNLSAGLQTLLPGETARAHRHTLQAIRFVMQGGGALTSVNAQACEMHEGDLVLTPAWTWHEHVHPGTERMVWFDGLDLPLCRDLDTMFFELGGMPGAAQDSVDPPETRAPLYQPQAVNLKPDIFDSHGGYGSSPSRFRYAGDRAFSVLAASAPWPDGSKLLRYVSGDSLGPVLSTLDCYLQSLALNKPTQRTRSTSNAVCVVARGSGCSQVGEQTFHWQKNDVFSLPHWNWISHTAATDDAAIFMMTDRELLASLGYLKDEVALDESTA